MRTALVSETALVNGLVACAECGARARALPGESYSEDDAVLFNDLVAMLREAAITPQNAAQLGMELDARSHENPGRGLRRLAQVLPSLGILELIVAHKPTPMRKAEGMLALLLDALASSRNRQSGFIPAAPTSAETQLKRVKTGEGEG